MKEDQKRFQQMMQANADDLLESLREVSGQQNPSSMQYTEEGASLGQALPRKRHATIDQPPNRRQNKSMSQYMVENSRFGMGQQPDQFYPPGMQAGFAGFSDSMGGHQSYGNQYFPSLDASGVPFSLNPFETEVGYNYQYSLKPS